MNDKFLNNTGLSYYHNRVKTIFADKTEVQDVADDLETLNDKVDDIIAEGGEPNVIETVKVNNTALTPDASKAVNIDLSGYAETSDVPTKTSDLTNDGDGTSNFATEDYVDENGGKINSISIDGTTQTIDANKNVALDLSAYALDSDIPTKTSVLTNDSGFQTASDVDGAIDDALANGTDPYLTESEVDTKIDSALTSAMIYKGSVATKTALPASGNKVGDFYNVLDEETNYAWDGTKWDPTGGTIDTSTLWAKSELTAITTAEIDTIVAGS